MPLYRGQQHCSLSQPLVSLLSRECADVTATEKLAWLEILSGCSYLSLSPLLTLVYDVAACGYFGLYLGFLLFAFGSQRRLKVGLSS